MSFFSNSSLGFRLASFGAALIVLTACSSNKKEKLAYVERPAELIYNQAVLKWLSVIGLMPNFCSKKSNVNIHSLNGRGGRC